MSIMGGFSCCRQHTLVYLPQTGRLCTFGLGANGQLGVEATTNAASPLVVGGPFVPPGESSSSDKSWVVKRISSAGDQCFVIVTAPRVSSSWLIRNLEFVFEGERNMKVLIFSFLHQSEIQYVV